MKTVTGQRLADILDVSPARISQAARNGELVKGHPIDEWAVFGRTGQVTGFDIPESVSRITAQIQEESSGEAEPDFKIPFASKLANYSGHEPPSNSLTMLSSLAEEVDEDEAEPDSGGAWEAALGIGAVLAGVWVLGQLLGSNQAGLPANAGLGMHADSFGQRAHQS